VRSFILSGGKMVPRGESYATTDMMNRCLSLVWWRERLARWRRFATSRKSLPAADRLRHFAERTVQVRKEISLQHLRGIAQRGLQRFRLHPESLSGHTRVHDEGVGEL